MLGFGDRSERIVVDLEQRRVVSGSLSLSPPQGFCHLMWVPMLLIAATGSAMA